MLNLKRTVLVVLLAAAVLVPFSVTASPQQHSTAIVAYATIPMFSTEAAAQRHCPYDQVVWLNIRSGIYHLKGMRWYGRTEDGAYVCHREADAAGYRETRNGQ
ncbi:MAG: hypothetical protein ACYC8W_04710 [Candidatus Tyrphobacter sp.]